MAGSVGWLAWWWNTLYKELYNAKVLTLKTLIVIPINKIKIAVYKPNLLNINPELIIVA